MEHYHFYLSLSSKHNYAFSFASVSCWRLSLVEFGMVLARGRVHPGPVVSSSGHIETNKTIYYRIHLFSVPHNSETVPNRNAVVQ